jgi:hypothetical protein
MAREELAAKEKKRELSIQQGRTDAKVLKQKQDRGQEQKDSAHHAFKHQHYNKVATKHDLLLY